MKCHSPFMKWDMQYKQYIPFPCGKCIACRSHNSQGWTLRMQFEAMKYSHDDIMFLTLTYSDEHLPDGANLSPADLTNFWKRLRFDLDTQCNRTKIRYFACGEYGEKKGRPHYHAIIFGLKQEHFSFVEKAWGKGRVQLETPRDKDASYAYVASYVTKKLGTQAQVSAHYGNRVPPFLRCSKGLGKNAIDHFPHFSQVVKIGERVYSLPRYLRNKLADKFGILEEVKKQGIAKLVVEMQDVMLEYYTKFKDSVLEVWNEIGNPPLAWRENHAWRVVYQGVFNEQKARWNMREMKRTRSIYNE